MCGSWWDFGIRIALGAVACVKICWCSSQLTLHLPLGLERATAGCTGTPLRHHVIRDVRCYMVGAQAVGSQMQSMFERLNVFVFEVISWVVPVAQPRTSVPPQK